MNARTLLVAVLAGLALLVPLGATAQPDAPPWKFSVMPYLWLPSVDGKINYGPPPGGGSANVSIDADTLLDNLDFAFMINGEARKGRWLVATDVIYLDFANTDSTVRSVDLNPGPGRINVATGPAQRQAAELLKGGCGPWWAATPRWSRGRTWT